MNLKKTLTVLFLYLLSLSTVSQTKKPDRIIKRDYQIIDCTISKMSDKTVEYSMPNETMTITLDVDQIARIDFASGRSQTFDSTTNNSNIVSDTNGNNTVNFKENTIAVLPRTFCKF